ncbi:ribosomal RNA-processing protein 8 [Ophiocordyceps camponoti-floridani]|uniref:Ribosomal RNA-processing protein 8 n=1 Tax=Ophiocordyceps camponoti-floridani TaxID=2030778 RepID=A0A8H4Q6S8_9HYPO|nr:ribosomal RNA-processing protein 8 [Ophiocordyceps camponoti-floridani]
MFAVPGWSVSADSLKAEKVPAGDGSETSRSKKRKRAGTSVTAANVVDLYETVFEGKKNKNKKREQPSGDDDGGAKVRTAKDSQTETKAAKSDKKKKAARPDVKEDANSQLTRHEGDEKSKTEKEAGKQKKQKQQPEPESRDATDSKAPAPASQPEPPKQPPAAKLTPLQTSMKEKLVSARFRHLNETLYTRPSAEALRLFDESPDMFDDYHQGFRRQVKVWPENPVDSFLQDIRARARAKIPAVTKARPGDPPAKRMGNPLPRTAGTCTIADLGCGDARLAESLEAEKLKLRLKLLSYDLHSVSPMVTRADIAHLPLEDGSINVAIFCLALMGTNWIEFIEEAYRILHWKGELWVAEIKSRFGPVRNAHNPVSHSVGNRKKTAAKAPRSSEKDGPDAEDLTIEVDGAEDRRHQTDVSAFVEVLRRRGFVLRGEANEAIDLSNRMFVKMHFVKAAAPMKGKGAKAQEAAVKTTKGAVAKKWLGSGTGDNTEDADEAAILKPCVYKTR